MSQHAVPDIRIERSPGFARLAGAMYLVTMATAVFAEAYVRRSLLVSDSAAQTAANLAASGVLFRLGLAADLLTYSGVVVLVWALYQLLRPVDAKLALIAMLFRLVEIGIHMSALVFGLAAVSFLGGAEYTKAFDAQTLPGLAGFAVRAQYAGLLIGFIPLGIGSALFALLLFRSRLVPRWLAGGGIVASALLALYAFASLTALFQAPVLMFPMFLYEVSVGAWLLLRAKPPMPAAGFKAAPGAVRQP